MTSTAIAVAHGLPASRCALHRRCERRRADATILMVGDLDKDARETLQHELTHRFMHAQLREEAVWFSEGSPSTARRWRWKTARPGSDGCRGTTSSSSSPVRSSPSAAVRRCAGSASIKLPTVQWLLDATPKSFYEHVDDNAAPEQPLAYPGAWLLVRLLASPNQPYAARFRRNGRQDRRRRHPREAFAAAFAGVLTATLSMTIARSPWSWRGSVQVGSRGQADDRRPLASAGAHGVHAAHPPSPSTRRCSYPTRACACCSRSCCRGITRTLRK